jgi:hypothetical protein
VIGGVRYLNSGDWVESLTAIVEEMDGSVRVVNRVELQSRIATAQEQAAQEQVAQAVA